MQGQITRIGIGDYTLMQTARHVLHEAATCKRKGCLALPCHSLATWVVSPES